MDKRDKMMLFKIRTNVLEMLQDRDFEVSSEIKNISFDEYNAMCDNDDINILVKKEGIELYVYFYNKEKSFGKKELKDIVESTKETYSDDINIIFILNKYNKSAIDKELIQDNYKNIEYIPSKQMTFNITKNYLVPRHILLSDKEKKEVFVQYKTNSLDSFPIIKRNDPIVKYYGMKPGDLCKIIRSSPTAGISVVYRGVA